MEPGKLVGRVRVRFLDDEERPGDEAIEECLTTVCDRLCIQLDVDEPPDKAASIAVDAAMKAVRLRGFEGSTSESSSDGGSISNSFIDNVLDAYADDIARLYASIHRGKVRFL